MGRIAFYLLLHVKYINKSSGRSDSVVVVKKKVLGGVKSIFGGLPDVSSLGH